MPIALVPALAGPGVAAARARKSTAAAITLPVVRISFTVFVSNPAGRRSERQVSGYTYAE
jgi:hypothetical protein